MCTPREKRGWRVCDPSPLTKLDWYCVSDTGLLLEYVIPNPISPHRVVHVSVSHGLGALKTTLCLHKL